MEQEPKKKLSEEAIKRILEGLKENDPPNITKEIPVTPLGEENNITNLVESILQIIQDD